MRVPQRPDQQRCACGAARVGDELEPADGVHDDGFVGVTQRVQQVGGAARVLLTSDRARRVGARQGVRILEMQRRPQHDLVRHEHLLQ